MGATVASMRVFTVAITPTVQKFGASAKLILICPPRKRIKPFDDSKRSRTGMNSGTVNEKISNVTPRRVEVNTTVAQASTTYILKNRDHTGRINLLLRRNASIARSFSKTTV